MAPNEVKLGIVYTSVFKNDEQANCQAGLDAKSVQTFCSFSDISNIQYIFELKKSDDDKIILPSEALKQAKLVEIVWFAKKTQVKLKPTSTTLNTTLTDSKKVTPKTTVMKSMAVVPVDIKTAYEAQEKRLNSAYSSFNITLVKLQPTSAKSSVNTNESDKLSDFINAQRVWKKYRNDNCHWHFTLANDKETMEHQKMVCLERMTRERADEIEQTLKQISK